MSTPEPDKNRMTPERWRLVKGKLDDVLRMDASRRVTFLAEIERDDQELHREVQSLLAAHEQVRTDFLDTPVIVDAGVNPATQEMKTMIGRRVGAYQIVEQIGIGGMGEVYRAFRADDHYRKEVAIKLVRAGQGSALVVSRFKHERQILASLDHPNIARLLDGGSTEEGVPYFVMELINGQPIDEYGSKLTTPARLELFLQVCSAVQYAHQRLIIHRDIKPGNILVTSDGTPKLLDFGIAKILDPSAAENLGSTMTLFQVLTPGYASPEQIRAEPITTASDVFSLGVVLYEVLTGHHPYRAAGDTAEKLARAVCEVEPKKPSTIVRGTGNSSRNSVSADANSAYGDRDGKKLSKRLKGDLDNIVLMALRKEPQRRYASVEQFAEDIRRHLENLPVIARADTLRYRASKFVRRHKAAVVATAIVVVALLAGMTITLMEKRRADRRFNDVRKLANSLIFEIHDSVEAVPGTTATRKLIVDRALEYLDSLASESTTDLSLQSELAGAYRRIGDAQGGQFQANLGDTAGALKSFQKALDIRKRIYAAGSNRLEDTVALAESYRTVSDKLLSTGQTGEAYGYIQRAVQLGENALPSHPDDPSLIQELARDYETEADLLGGNSNLSNLGDTTAALVARRKDVEVSEHLAKLRPEDPFVQRFAAISVIRMGDQLYLAGRRQESLNHYLQAKPILEKLATQSPTAKLQDNLHSLYQRLNNVEVADGNYTQALESTRSALEISRRLTAADPRDKWARLGLAEDYDNLAECRSRVLDKREAIPAIVKALDIMNDLVTHDPKNTELQGAQSSILVTAGDVYRRSGNNSKALIYYRKAQAITAKMQADDPKNADARLRLAANYNSVATALVPLGDTKAATELYEKALALVQAEANSKPPSEQALYSSADSSTGLADVEGKLAEKEKQPDRRLAHWKKDCGLYEASMKTWSAVREPGETSPEGFDCVPPATVRARLMKCQAAIAAENSHQ